MLKLNASDFPPELTLKLKQQLANRAQRLLSLIKLNAPDCMIENECLLVFDCMMILHGDALFACYRKLLIKSLVDNEAGALLSAQHAEENAAAERELAEFENDAGEQN